MLIILKNIQLACLFKNTWKLESSVNRQVRRKFDSFNFNYLHGRWVSVNPKAIYFLCFELFHELLLMKTENLCDDLTLKTKLIRCRLMGDYASCCVQAAHHNFSKPIVSQNERNTWHEVFHSYIY